MHSQHFKQQASTEMPIPTPLRAQLARGIAAINKTRQPCWNAVDRPIDPSRHLLACRIELPGVGQPHDRGVR